MATEIEAKFRIPAPDPVRQRLRALGAQPAGRVHERNRIFDTPERLLLRSDCGLRIRECRPLPPAAPGPDVRPAAPGAPVPPAELTYKGPRAAPAPGTAGDAGLKSREELATAVDDPAALVGILERLGYRAVIEYEKRREMYRLAGCEIALDELPRLGWWLEIEGPDAAAVEAARGQLGLATAPAVAETYVEMAAAHGEADAAGGRRLRFEAAG